MAARHTAAMPDQPPCGCGCANTFGSKEADDDLKRYRERGPDPTTKALIDAIVAEGVDGATLLDIGSGIGAIQIGLLEAGAARAETVDASAAYVEVARAEAERRGIGDRTNGRVGDFAQLADEVPAADVVTLDRVVCCYSDIDALLAAVTSHAGRMVGLVYPPPTRLMRTVARIGNVFTRLFRMDLRFYAHSLAAIEGPLLAAGFVKHPLKRTLIWQVALYVRSGG